MSRGSLLLYLYNFTSCDSSLLHLPLLVTAATLCADSSDNTAAIKAVAIGSCKYIINTRNRLVYTPFYIIAAVSVSKAFFISLQRYNFFSSWTSKNSFFLLRKRRKNKVRYVPMQGTQRL